MRRCFRSRFRSRGPSRIAAGECLAVALAFAPPLSAQAPDGSGSAQPSSTVQGQGEGQANRGQQDAGRFSVPVRIIEDPIEAERAEQRAERAERAEKREADDLITQQRSAAAAERGADAAESQKAATWLQTSLAAVARPPCSTRSG
jgi:hypothetical protein